MPLPVIVAIPHLNFEEHETYCIEKCVRACVRVHTVPVYICMFIHAGQRIPIML